MTEAILIIRPHRLRVIGRAKCLIKVKQLFRLVFKTASQSSSSILKSRLSLVIPALLTKISIKLCFSSNSAQAHSTAVASDTSRASDSAEPPSCRICSATAPQDDSERLTQMT